MSEGSLSLGWRGREQAERTWGEAWTGRSDGAGAGAARWGWCFFAGLGLRLVRV